VAKLTQPQLLELVPLVAVYTFDRLDTLLRAVTGEARIRDLGSDKMPPAALAKAVLDDASDSGYADVLLRTMLKQPDCRPALRAAALTIFPSLSVADNPFKDIVTGAVQAIEANRALLATPEAKRAAATFAGALIQLTRFRGLHSAIMRVANTSMPQAPSADGTDLGLFLADVDQALAQIDGALREVRAAFATSDIATVPQSAWIDGFDRALAALQAARASQDAGGALDIIDDVAGQATFVLGYSNGVIAATYGLLPFAPLSTALGGTAPEARTIDTLRDALKDIVEEHDAWQQAYRGLVRLDRCLHAPPRNAFVAFSGAWSQTRSNLERLVGDPRGLPWAREAREAMTDLDTILTEVANQATDDELSSLTRRKLKGSLDDLRDICRNRFLTVATNLKSRLAEMADLQASLSSIGTQQ
jgi:hypothetical protein